MNDTNLNIYKFRIYKIFIMHLIFLDNLISIILKVLRKIVKNIFLKLKLD